MLIIIIFLGFNDLFHSNNSALIYFFYIAEDDELSRQRRRLHNKVLGPHVPTKEKTTFKETFLPPELSMITFFMTKVHNIPTKKPKQKNKHVYL